MARQLRPHLLWSVPARVKAWLRYAIVKGKGKMEGEGDRIKAEMAWKLVNYVRTLAKKEHAPKELTITQNAAK